MVDDHNDDTGTLSTKSDNMTKLTKETEAQTLEHWQETNPFMGKTVAAV